MDTFTLVIGISLLIYIVVGNYAGRSVRELDDYFVAGRRAPTILILGTLVASVFSTSVFMGEAAFTYDSQFGAYMLFPGVAVTGYTLGALFFGTYLRRSRAPTVADYFGQRFGSKRLQKFAGFTIILGLGGYLLIVTQGASILLSDLTGLSYLESLFLAWISYTAFTMYSGSKGVILTDTIMFLLFMGASVFFAWYVFDGLGGVPAAIEGLSTLNEKDGIASWSGIVGEGTDWPEPIDYVIWAVVIDSAWALVYAVGPWQASRHLMARDEHVVLRAAILAGVCVIVLQMLVYGTAGSINLAKPDIDPSETVLIWAAQNLVPEILGAILLAGIVAAAVSSASTFLSLVGFSISNDIRQSDTPLTLKSTRIVMLVTGFLALVGCIFFPPDIFWFMLFIGTVFASSWGPVGIMSIWSKRITSDAAFWGMVTGFFMNVIPAAMVYLDMISLPSYLDPAVIGTVCSIVVILVVSARGTVNRTNALYRMRLHRTPIVDLDMTKVKKTMLAPMGMVAYALFMPFVMIQYYVIPYQTGTGQLLADGSVNWNTGEALICLTITALHLPIALMALKVIWDRYSPTTLRNRTRIKRAKFKGEAKVKGEV